MNLAPLVEPCLADPVLAAAVDAAAAASPRERTLVVCAGLRPVVAAALAAHRPVLLVTATGREAEELAGALADYLAPGSVALYPSWETLPHERLSPRPDTVGRRLAVLRRLAHPEEGPGPVRVVVATVRGLVQPQVRGLGEIAPVRLAAGDREDLDTVVERLVYLGYQRCELVERRGEFAVRGGLLDCFPPTAEHPLRVEFFGDDVEEVRQFSAADQRSLAPAPGGLEAPPCRELLLTAGVRARAAALAEEHPELAETCHRVAAGDPVEGMEALAPVLAEELGLLLDELPPATLVALVDPERVRTRAEELVRTSREFLEAGWQAAATGGAAPVDLEPAAYRTLAEVRERARGLGLPWWGLASFGEADQAVAATPVTPYRGDTDRALADLASWVRAGHRVVLLARGHGPAQRLAELLAGADLPGRYAEHLPEQLPAGVALATTGGQETGFLAPGVGLCVLTERDLAGHRDLAGTREGRRLPVRRRGGLDPLQLSPGDPVVHEQHGVARYVEMVRRTVHGGEREYMVLEYAKGDRLYVPTDSLEAVTRYVGGESPALSRLGGADWAKTKGRARKAVREIAAELIRLYSARMASPGRAFGPDTPWQRELEDAFPYQETPDQLAAINEVKADMERPVPMDRVVCGDVGYGKTEIAVRAAFKAVQDGAQVAVLVPTTLLVQQHLSTFTERFGTFPVTVAALSRFSSATERSEVLAGLAAGRVDVVIGTHRLLSPDTRFADLGLVIVDEEQRFGVEHKEYLKRLRTAVDVLTMSATPIPRTLEMSLTGIREMSTILTPPEERHPVLTVVGAYDERQVAAAIRRELLREGQVFYVHNRVESIDRAAHRVRELVPEARVGVAHGQMAEDALERVMIGFWEQEYDVLVCTTIVESGLDVSNANTLVVERADTLGLAQLHQLRGRVGRSSERGYAYLLYPPERLLTETAHDRLATVAQNTELGSGMAVALKDLEIRGAGNLLGGEQAGHIAGVGFDLYVRMVGEAVAEFKGGSTPAPAEVKVDLPVDAHLPHDYISAERLRLSAYRRLSEALTDAEVDAVGEELRDRFGPLPVAVLSLLALARFRVHLRRHGVSEVSLQGSSVRFTPLRLRDSQQVRLARLYPRSVVKQALGTVLVPRPTATGRMGAPPLRDVALLTWCRELLDTVVGDPLAGAAAGSPPVAAPAAADLRA